MRSAGISARAGGSQICWLKLVQGLVPIEQSGLGRQALVTSRPDKGRPDRLGIDRHDADRLHDVDDEEELPLRAQRANAFDIEAVTGVEGHMRHRDRAGHLIDMGKKAFCIHDFRHRQEAHLDTLPLQIEKSVGVVRMIAVDHQDILART